MMIRASKVFASYALTVWIAGAGAAAVGAAPSAKVVAKAAEAKPQADVTKKTAPAEIPPVRLSKGHEALCKVKVGDTMPDVTLPPLTGGAPVELSSLFGEKATLVVFWSPDRRMAREQLADLGPDVVAPFGEAGVAVVGIAVGAPAAMLKAAEREFPNLLDADGKAFSQVGSAKLPRTYLLDPQGKILWFDIEYSLGTRRELHQSLRAVAGEPAGAKQE
jgi:peroxiredoxin